MKSILITFMIFISCYSFSQNNDLNQNAKWNCIDMDGTTQCKDTYKYNLYFSGDSIINGNQYLKLYKVGYMYNSLFSSFCNAPPSNYCYFNSLVRYYQNKLLIYNGTSEKTFIDYNLQLGDTIKNVLFSLYDALKIHRIDSVNINSNYLKRYHYKSISNINDSGYVIEKIGSNHGFISEFTPFFESYKKLICYSENNITLYNEPSASDNCELTLGVIEKDNTESTIIIYPNPTSNSFSIRSKNYKSIIKAITITNYLGEIISRENYTSNSKFNLSNMSNGIYYVLIESETGTFVRKIIKE